MSQPDSGRAVLYACTTINGDTTRILAELRQHARARGWDVVGEYADNTGAAAEADRPQFQRAKAAIRDGVADILVTRYPAMAAYLDGERAALVGWLEEQGATAHYTHTRRPTEARS